MLGCSQLKRTISTSMPNTKLIIGIDEAGYGPNMGPLVVCATAWRAPLELDVCELGQMLAPEFQAKPLRKEFKHVPIGDSKLINQGKTGHASLFSGAQFLLGAIAKSHRSQSIDEVLAWISPEDCDRIKFVPWYSNCCLPRECADNSRELENSSFQDAEKKMAQLGLSLLDARARVVDEPEFNRQVDRIGNKSSLLSELSLNLARTIIDRNAAVDEPIFVYCDKHGGRNRYQPFLMASFDQKWFSIQAEEQRCSEYKADWAGSPMTIQFQVAGDSIFPSAASSILCKWIREEHMLKLNAFWQSNSESAIAPTAGYYVDATRFSKQIELVSQKLNLSRENWWRKK